MAVWVRASADGAAQGSDDGKSAGTTRGRWPLAVLAAAMLVVACVAVRLPWMDRVGYAGDLRFFQRWASTAYQLRTDEGGLGRIYAERRDCNYPPFYVAVLSYLPQLYRWRHPDRLWDPPRLNEQGMRRAAAHSRFRSQLLSLAPFLKTPALVADVAITLVVFAWLWARSGWMRAVLGGGLWALNPVSVYNGAYFGQVDAIHSLWMLAALLAAIEQRPPLAWSFAAVALLTKLQSIVILPVIAVVTCRPLAAALWAGRYEAAKRAGIALVKAGAAAALVLGVALAPYARAGTLSDVRRVYAGSVGEKHTARITVTAYNLWWMTQTPPVMLNRIPRDQRTFVGPFTARQLGYLSFTVLAAAVCLLVIRGGGPRTATLAAVVLALGFFLVSTQMKSRYGFAALALTLPLLAFGYRYLLVTVALSVAFLLNAVRVLTLPKEFFVVLPALNRLGRMPEAGHVVAGALLALLLYLLIELCIATARDRRASAAGVASPG